MFDLIIRLFSYFMRVDAVHGASIARTWKCPVLLALDSEGTALYQELDAMTWCEGRTAKRSWMCTVLYYRLELRRDMVHEHMFGDRPAQNERNAAYYAMYFGAEVIGE